MTRSQAAAVLAVLAGLIALAVPALGGEPTPFATGPVRTDGVLGWLVDAADGRWDLGVMRSCAALAGVGVALGLIVVLSGSDARRRVVVVGLVAGTCLALTVPAVLVQVALREGTAPWFHANDASYQIELGGDVLLDGANPYGHDYSRSGMERIYSADGSAPSDPAGIVALYHYPYFPGMAIVGAAWRLLPEPLADVRILDLLATLGLLGAALAYRGPPLHVRLAIGAALAANPLAIRGAWFGTIDAPALLALAGAFVLAGRRRFTAAFALVAAAILIKQFAVVALPFLALEAYRGGGSAALRRPLVALVGVLAAAIVPFAIWDAGALYDDTIAFGAQTYRVIGYGLAALLVRAGIVDRGGSYPFPLVVLVTWLPATIALLVAQRRRAKVWLPTAGFAASMFLLVFVARVFQTSYLAYPLLGVALAILAATTPAERARTM